MVMAQLRAGYRGRYDAFFYEDRIVLRRVPGVDAERVGSVIGLVLGWIGVILGAWIGRHIAAAGNADRICPLEWVPSDKVVASDDRNRVVLYRSIADIEVRVASGGGWLCLREGDGRKSRFRWHAIHNPATDVPALVRAVVGPGVRVTRRRARQVLTITAATLIAALPMMVLAAAIGSRV